MELAMNGKEFCLWGMLLVLLLHDSVGQEEEVLEMVAADVEMTTGHVVPSTAAAMQQEALDTETVAPADPVPAPPADSAPEPPDDSAPEPPDDSAPEPPDDSAPQPPADPAPGPPADPVPEPPDDSAPEPPDDSAPEPPDDSAPEPPDDPAPETPDDSAPEPPADPVPEPPAEPPSEPPAEPAPEPVPLATPTMPGDLDYQNDAQDTSEKTTQKSSSEAPMPTKPNTVVDSNSGVNCYSCSSYQKGNCDAKPIEKMPCSASSKNGCYTLIKRDTKLIMRGCISELTEEGDKYCRKEPKLCKMCYQKLCNKETAPPLNAGSASFFLVSLLIWIPCVIVSF